MNQVSKHYLTPNAIEVLIHYHATSTRHPRHFAPAVIEARQQFIKLGIIEPAEIVQNVLVPLEGKIDYESHDIYCITELGKKWVESLCRTQLPNEERDKEFIAELKVKESNRLKAEKFDELAKCIDEMEKENKALRETVELNRVVVTALQNDNNRLREKIANQPHKDFKKLVRVAMNGIISASPTMREKDVENIGIAAVGIATITQRAIDEKLKG